VYPGQTIKAYVSSAGGTKAALYLSYYGHDDEQTRVTADAETIGAETTLSMTVPADAHPVFEVGVTLPEGGTVAVDWLTWAGTPGVSFTRPGHRGTMWRRAFVNGADVFDSRVEPIRVIQNAGCGLLIQGTRDWQDYQVSADITPHLVETAGLAGRVQGMRRYYALQWRGGALQLVRMLDSEAVLASCDYDWSLGETRQLSLQLAGDDLIGLVDGKPQLRATDVALDCGGIALLVEGGRSATQSIQVQPVRD
jgi:hypothetical protein